MLKKLLFIDVETTGLDTAKDGITQIAGSIDYIWRDGEPAQFKQSFNYMCRPFSGDRKLDPKSEDTINMLINCYGATEETIEEKIDEIYSRPDPIEVFKKLSRVLDAHCNPKYPFNKFQMIGANSKFDYSMMRRWMEQCCGEDLWFSKYTSYHCIDIQQLAMMFKFLGKIKSRDLKLGTIAKKLGVEIKVQHDADHDIRATKQIFYKFKQALSKVNLETELTVIEE